MDKDLKNKTLCELTRLVADLDQKDYLAKYIFTFIHTQNAGGIDEITPLSKAFRRQLMENGFYISSLKMLDKLTDPDVAVKFLFQLPDGLGVESALLIDKNRKTLCVSCQAGCRMGCSFCATGRIKFQRNLNAGEIVDQLNCAQKQYGRINNIVYMGMGEPMDNYDNVIRATHIFNHPDAKNIAARHITISTCGIAEGIETLADENLQVRLAVSLHGPKDSIRNKIMPVAEKYPLDMLLQSVRKYQRKAKRRVTFEYCMIKGINDSQDNAKALVKLIKPIKAAVNLIEYNPHPGCKFSPAGRKQIRLFADILSQAGIETIIRYKRGQKIMAACGQLGAKHLQKH